MDILSAGTTVAIKSIALVTLVPSAGPPVSPLWQFDTDGDFKGWVPSYSGVLDMTVSGGRLRIKTYTDTTLLAPPASIPTQMEWFSLSGRVDNQLSRARFFYSISSARHTMIGHPKGCVQFVPDAADHVYNQNFGWTKIDGGQSHNCRLPYRRIQPLRLSGFKSPMPRRDPQMFSWMPWVPLRPWFVPGPRFSSPAGCRTAGQGRSSSCQSN